VLVWIVQVAIPPCDVAFQVGEAWQIASGGMLRATPHCVRATPAGASKSAPRVSRNTFAVFMQPSVTASLDCPQGEPRSCLEAA
jgi:isopenicillin N synthase-like dioxygenase